MDWTDPIAFSHFFQSIHEDHQKLTYHYIDQGQDFKNPNQEIAVLLHGFPDLWYGWRFVIPLLVEKGFRVICPDLRGYGQTDAPPETQSYALQKIADDVLALLSKSGLNIPLTKKIYFIGHDWGGEVVYRIAQKYPERVKGIVSICTPYWPRTRKFVPLEDIVQPGRWPSLKYMLYFQTEEAEKEMNRNTKRFLQFIYSRPGSYQMPYSDETTFISKTFSGLDTTSCLLNPKELSYYVSQYVRGFHAPLSWYRNGKRNWEDSASLPREISVPVFFIQGGKDIFLVPSMGASMRPFVKNLTTYLLPECGHWIPIEEPRRVVDLITKWMEGLPLSPISSKL